MKLKEGGLCSSYKQETVTRKRSRWSQGVYSENEVSIVRMRGQVTADSQHAFYILFSGNPSLWNDITHI